MGLTAGQRKRAAKEARKLASEICGGRAPALDPYSYCGCAAGEIVKRLLGIPEITSDGEEDPAWCLAREIDQVLPESDPPRYWDEGIVSAGLRHSLPLLALADALDAPAPPTAEPAP